MQSMVHQAVRLLRLVLAALLVTVAGCASRTVAEATSAPRARPAELVTEEQRMMACLDLRDHIVSIYADEYAEQQGLDLSSTQRDAFHNVWSVDVAKRGTFESFERSCFVTLTPRKYRCGMASQSADGLVACMKLSSR
jgi:hypothetical protein